MYDLSLLERRLSEPFTLHAYSTSRNLGTSFSLMRVSFIVCLAPDCHIDIGRDVSTPCCMSSSGDSVALLSRIIYTTVVVSDWGIANLARGWWVSIQGTVGSIRGGNCSLIMPAMSWIETHQPRTRFVIHQ